jgi:cystathionine beta-lyase family protein involved in aluminum resistance
MKQETLEEFANKYSKYNLTKEALEFAKTISYAFKESKQDELVVEAVLTGIQWLQKRSYSEEEVKESLSCITLVDPSHLIMTSDGCGEFPDSYKLTEKGINHIIEQFKKK